MKRNRVTRLLTVLLVAVCTMAWAGTALSISPPGNGPAIGSENENGSGTQDRARDGSCEEVLEIFGFAEEEDPLPPGEGKMTGSQNDTGSGTKDRTRDPTTHEE